MDPQALGRAEFKSDFLLHLLKHSSIVKAGWCLANKTQHYLFCDKSITGKMYNNNQSTRM